MPSEGRAGLEGVCQRDAVICFALTRLLFSLLVPENQSRY